MGKLSLRGRILTILLTSALAFFGLGPVWAGASWQETIYELGYEGVADPPYDAEAVTLETPWIGYLNLCTLYGVRPWDFPYPGHPDWSDEAGPQVIYTEYHNVETGQGPGWRVRAELTDPTHTHFANADYVQGLDKWVIAGGSTQYATYTVLNKGRDCKE